MHWRSIDAVIDDPTDAVRAQYERWVYPQPIDDISTSPIRDLSDPVFMGRAYWPDRPPREDLKILVAGCGPNVAARLAYHHPKSEVVGIDISEASLAHEHYLKAKHDLRNLSLHHCRVEDAAGLGKSFDFIESTGVLHHLPDATAGLKALASLLTSDGVIFLMLYGKYGRAGIYMAQELFRILKLGQSPQDVAILKTALSAFRPDHPLRQQRLNSKDLAFDAGIVDMFLHRQDRGFTVGDCLELVDSAGLVLQDWLSRYLFDPASQFPNSNLREIVSRLPEREAWKAIELFDGRIAMHSFYACRRDRDPSRYRIDFNGAAFMDMVPVLRIGWVGAKTSNKTLLLQQNLTGMKFELDESAAAVAAHIDGKRSVRSCFQESSGRSEIPEPMISSCRELFRQLWLAGYCDLVHADAAVAP